MKIIKVDATTSTNRLARVLNKANDKENFCVSAEFQTEGRGQLNNSWQSIKSENLMFTVVLSQLQLDIKNQFLLNALVCLKMFKILKKYELPKLSLKWPNDILSENFKISGVLIENSLSGNFIRTAFIGIGLNVNQTRFEKLPHASSLKRILNHSIEKEQLLKNLVEELETIPQDLELKNFDDILKLYKSHLYKFNTKSEFLGPDGKWHSATIRDVASDGQLLVEFESGEQTYFRHKEIKQQL